jgi:ethanolamine utilization protein EutN
MYIGRVIGTVVSTRKCASLIGAKFLVVQPLDEQDKPEGPLWVAVDSVGAGIGMKVLMAVGSPAHIIMQKAPVDAAIVGIIDTIQAR